MQVSTSPIKPSFDCFQRHTRALEYDINLDSCQTRRTTPRKVAHVDSSTHKHVPNRTFNIYDSVNVRKSNETARRDYTLPAISRLIMYSYCTI